jgi:hypothetical protein
LPSQKGGSSFGVAAAASLVFALLCNDFIYVQPENSVKIRISKIGAESLRREKNSLSSDQIRRMDSSLIFSQQDRDRAASVLKWCVKAR